MVRLIDNGTAISFRVIVCDIINVTASHIHVGAAGTNGPVIIPFFHGIFSTPHGSKTLSEGTQQAADDNTHTSPSITSWKNFVKTLLVCNSYVSITTTPNQRGDITAHL